MIDRYGFPRTKPCGGGLSIKALKCLPWSAEPVLRHSVKEIRVGVRQNGESHFERIQGRDDLCAFAVRSEFDRFNFDMAVAASVEFESGARLSAIDSGPKDVRVILGRHEVTARFLVGADGANSSVRRLISAEAHFRRGFAIEGTVDCAHLDCKPVAELVFGYVRHGYAWSFPKRDHINVGIYACDDRTPLSKGQLREYVCTRFHTDALANVVGFPLGFGGRQYDPNHERIILAGDAAGLAEPLLGEGIYNALKSGQAAASAIAAFDRGMARTLSGAYRKALAPIRHDLGYCDELASLFYPHLAHGAFPALAFLLRRGAIARALSEGRTAAEMIKPWQIGCLRMFGRFWEMIDRARFVYG